MTGRGKTSTKRSPNAVTEAEGEMTERQYSRTQTQEATLRTLESERPAAPTSKPPTQESAKAGAADCDRGARRKSPKQSDVGQKSAALNGKVARRQKPATPGTKSPTQESELPAAPSSKSPIQESERPAAPTSKPPTQESAKAGAADCDRGARRKSPKQSDVGQKSAALNGKVARRQKPATPGTKSPIQELELPAAPSSKSPIQESERPAAPTSKPHTQESAKAGAADCDRGARRKSPKQSDVGQKSKRHDRSVCRKNDDPDRVLQMTLEKLKIKRDVRSNASKIKNDTIETIKTHLDRSTNFKGIKILPTGSYFENLKIGDPDEFDVMFTISVGRIVDVQSFSTDGAYYSARFKRPPRQHVLTELVSEDRFICASKIMTAFRKEVIAAVKTINNDGGNFKPAPKKASSPAVTLTRNLEGREISFDIVLGIEVEGTWPTCAADGMKIENWLGSKVRQNLRYMPYYLVPKHASSANTEEAGVLAKDVWRISFSHVEKAIMKNHGSEKTCCEEQGLKCCRKQCLKLLKHLLAELKAEHPSELSKFCSYQAKTTLLHACTVRANDSDWKLSDLHDCFQLLLQDFVEHLKKKELPNFFIPTHNLFGSVTAKGCRKLVPYIEHELNNGFPIFKKYLKD